MLDTLHGITSPQSYLNMIILHTQYIYESGSFINNKNFCSTPDGMFILLFTYFNATYLIYCFVNIWEKLTMIKPNV